MNNESDKALLGVDGTDRKLLVVRLTEYMGHRLVDLRYWYRDRKRDEMKPTSKGLMLTRSNYLKFREIIESRHEDIMDWLSVGYVPNKVKSYQLHQMKSADACDYSLPAARTTTADKHGDNSFFNVEHEGSSASVILNMGHPFIQKIHSIDDAKCKQEVLDFISNLVVAFDTAATRLLDSPSVHTSILFEQLEHDWSQYLSKVSKEKC